MTDLTDDSQELALSTSPTFSLVPRNFQEAMDIAAEVAKSDLVPRDYRNKPANVLIAMQMGMELGLPPLQAIQNIAVVNGRPAIWGDLLPALARSARDFEYMHEEIDEETLVATCRGKRKNQPEEIRSFSIDDAKTAGLWGKEGPWRNYPKRMLQMRARAFLVRDLFPDVLRGVAVREEIIDLDPTDYSDVTASGKPTVSMPKSKPASDKGQPAVTAPRARKSDADDKPAPTAEKPEAVSAGAGEPLTAGMIRTAEKQMQAAGILEAQLFGRFGVSAWEEIKRGQINDVLSWIKGGSS
jgi:hypothetical protein